MPSNSVLWDGLVLSNPFCKAFGRLNVFPEAISSKPRLDKHKRPNLCFFLVFVRSCCDSNPVLECRVGRSSTASAPDTAITSWAVHKSPSSTKCGDGREKFEIDGLNNQRCFCGCPDLPCGTHALLQVSATCTTIHEHSSSWDAHRLVFGFVPVLLSLQLLCSRKTMARGRRTCKPPPACTLFF